MLIICDVAGPDSSVIHRGWTLGHQNMCTKSNVCSEWSKSIKEKNDCGWGKNRVCTFGHHISPMAVTFFWLICLNQKKSDCHLGKNRVCTFGHQVGFNVNSQRVCFTPNRQWTSCTYFDVRVCKPYESPNGNRFFFDWVCHFFANYFKRHNFQGSFSVVFLSFSFCSVIFQFSEFLRVHFGASWWKKKHKQREQKNFMMKKNRNKQNKRKQNKTKKQNQTNKTNKPNKQANK